MTKSSTVLIKTCKKYRLVPNWPSILLGFQVETFCLNKASQIEINIAQRIMKVILVSFKLCKANFRQNFIFIYFK